MADLFQSFSTTVLSGKNGGARIELPFDVAATWGERDRYHVTGVVNRIKVRGPLNLVDGTFFLVLGPAWLRDSTVGIGDRVDVVLTTEGPQTEVLAPDIALALAEEPEARRFFESLATFYRKAYLTWLDGAKRRPELRRARIEEFVALLKAEKKQR